MLFRSGDAGHGHVLVRGTDAALHDGIDARGDVIMTLAVHVIGHADRDLLHNTLRELQYAGLVEIQKQGCGKPNRIYPKSYEAVPNTDFKKSGYGTRSD